MEFVFFCFLLIKTNSVKYQCSYEVDIEGISYCLFTDNQTAVITSINQNFENLSLNKTVEYQNTQFTNTRIDTNSEKWDSQITGSLTIPNTITYIGKSFFASKTITSLIFENDSQIEIIDEYAFNSTSLSGNLFIPSSLIKISDFAFYVTKITSISFQDSSNLQYIGHYAFAETNISVISFPSSLETIGEGAFSLCPLVTIEFFSENVIELWSFCFEYCNSLESISCQCKNLKIGSFAFNECKNLTKINISSCSIEKYAFYGCISLSNIKNINPSYIGSSAFSGTNITSYSGAAQIEPKAFSYCQFLQELSFSCPIIDNFSICSCLSLKHITFSSISVHILTIFDAPNLTILNFQVCNCLFSCDDGICLYSLPKLTGIFFDNCVVVFKPYSLDSLPALKEIAIYKSNITHIYSDAILDCPSLMLNFNVTELVGSRAFININPVEELIVTARRVEDYAYSSFLELKYVKIASTVEFLGIQFIDKCPNFISLEFLDTDATTPKLIISDYCFWKINTFDLHNKLTNRIESIGSYAFAGCTKITGSLEMPKMLKTIGSNAFQGCTGFSGFLDFTNCTQLTSIGNCAFLGCSKIKGSLTLPNSLNYIGEFAFTYCSFEGPLSIPDNVTTIASHAFAFCRTFTGSLYIGSSVKFIGDFAFSECTGLNGQLDIRSSCLESIGNNAFYGCCNIHGVLKIPDSVKTIGGLAFYNCQGFTNRLILPSKLEHIGESAFSFCSGFRGNLEIPSSVSFIGSNAFFQCKNLDKIYFSKNYNSSLVIQNKAFGDLHISCLSNVPPVCSVSNHSNKEGYPEKGNSRCYDSTGFGKLVSAHAIIESCSLKTFIEVLIGIAGIVGTTGVLGIASKFIMTWFENIYTHKKRIAHIFNEIIDSTRDKYQKDHNDAEAISHALTLLSAFFEQERQNPNFVFSKKTITKILIKSIRSEWPSIRYTIEQCIINECFDKIDFDELISLNKQQQKQNRFKCKCCNKNKDEQSLLMSNIL